MFGRAYLAAPKYKSVIFSSHRKDLALAAIQELDGFGNALPIFEQAASVKLAPVIQSYGMWKDDHNFSKADLPTILARATAFNKIAAQYKGIDFLFAPMLEHQISDAKLLAYILSESQKAAPKCQIINVPVHNGPTTKNYINEIHGINPRIPNSGRYNISNDGASLVDSDVSKWKLDHTKAGILWIWDPNDNLRLETNDKTPRAERNAALTVDCNNSLMFLTSDKGDHWIQAPHGFLYKSHAECHYIKGQAKLGLDARSNKPCIIMPQKVSKLQLVTAFKQVIATFGPAEKYTDGRWKYYAQDFGYKYAERAIALTKGPHLAVIGDGKNLAVINPAFRQNEYRGD